MIRHSIFIISILLTNISLASYTDFLPPDLADRTSRLAQAVQDPENEILLKSAAINLQKRAGLQTAVHLLDLGLDLGFDYAGSKILCKTPPLASHIIQLIEALATAHKHYEISFQGGIPDAEFTAYLQQALMHPSNNASQEEKKYQKYKNTVALSVLKVLEKCPDQEERLDEKETHQLSAASFLYGLLKKYTISFKSDMRLKMLPIFGGILERSGFDSEVTSRIASWLPLFSTKTQDSSQLKKMADILVEFAESTASEGQKDAVNQAHLSLGTGLQESLTSQLRRLLLDT